MRTRTLLLTLLLTLSAPLLATPVFAQADLDLKWDLQVSAERIHQTFDNGDADLDTLTFTPAMTLGDFSLTATVPWQHIDGTYFVNTVYPALVNACAWLNSLSNLRKLSLIRQGKLTLEQVQYCNGNAGVESATLDDSVEGAGDIELFANYFLPPLSGYASASLGLGYKFDNGDWETGLGSGTRDLFTEAALLLQGERLHLLLTLAYDRIEANATGLDLNDYGYGSIDAGWQCLDTLTLGLEYHYQQAITDLIGDLDYFTGYGDLQLGKRWTMRLFVTDYRGAEGYPEEEIGARLSWQF